MDARRIEISCGEAPYLVSRYDTVTGEFIELLSRIVLLDRKLRVVTENTLADLQKNGEILKLNGGRYSAYIWNSKKL